MNTGAIINTAPKPKKRLAEEFKNVQDDLNTLKEEMSEIKSLLKQLIQMTLRNVPRRTRWNSSVKRLT